MGPVPTHHVDRAMRVPNYRFGDASYKHPLYRADAEWICRLVEHGLVRPSFVPLKEIRELRNLTRYRKL